MKIGLAFPQRYYPRSFLGLLLLAFVLVALPLIVAFYNAAIYVEQLADQSQTAVSQAAQASRGSRLLVEQTTALERVVRQYLILGDPEQLKDYERLRASFKTNTSELSLQPLDDPQLRELNRTIDKEQSLYEQLRSAPPGLTDKKSLVEGYVILSDLARGVLEMSNAQIDREVEHMRLTGERAQRTLWLQLLATIPLGVLLALGASLVVAKPIQELDQAIRRLGAGEFDGDIRVGGPADLKYLGGRLEWLRQQLIELDQQKRLFLRHVSHELKTPLTALREGSELLAEGTAGPLAASQREIVGILQQKSVQLQRMIEDLLNYQRAQESVGRLELAAVRLDRVVERVLEDHQLAVKARGIRAELRLEPVVLQGDRDKLRVVAANLISNAIKYSPDGGIITLVLRRDGDHAVLEVGDAGTGIPHQDRDRIFDWFFQGERSHHGRVQGSGLGLAIAKAFVVAHGGRIEVVDGIAAGAHFRVSLPLEVSLPTDISRP
ncbi:MAG TPA: ATP-binding protein [Burkholderiales bacterium]|nr:ATP-binding protein [Burkholderiales bacterium]